MSYAVNDFFRNGGGQAIIVRAYNLPPPPAPPPGPGAPAPAPAPGPGAPAPAPAAPAPAALSTTGASQIVADSRLTLEAVSPGTWGDILRARIVTSAAEVAPGDDSLFNLSVALVKLDAVGNVLEITQLEVFRNVSLMDGHIRRVDNVLKAESKLVRAIGFTPVTGAVVKPTESAAPTPDNPIWGGKAGNNTSVGVSSKGSDGAALNQAALTGGTTQSTSTGLFSLDKADLFNLLCIPPDTRDGDTYPSVYQQAMHYCATRRAMLIVDPPSKWGKNKETAAATARDTFKEALPLSGPEARNAVLYFPRVRQADPKREGQIDTFAPCGIIAGLMARTDTARGVWKAPAGIDAALNGIQGLEVNLTDAENGMLNPLGINCLRNFPIVGTVAWGARTLRGADQLADEYKYVPIRRLALFIEETLYRGTQWVVFEPNDEPLWSQIRLNLGAFMHNLFRQGAFQGTTPRAAYFVKCDKETTTQDDINRGIVNIVVGFAPLKPAEFVIIQLQQIAGQIEV
jgi:phage tail sheath protein FI